MTVWLLILVLRVNQFLTVEVAIGDTVYRTAQQCEEALNFTRRALGEHLRDGWPYCKAMKVK